VRDIDTRGDVLNSNRSLVLLDLEGDGDLDLVVAMTTGIQAPENYSYEAESFPAHVYRNLGDLRFVPFQHLFPTSSAVFPVPRIYSQVVGDLNGDGRADLLQGHDASDFAYLQR
jgi:hypothetical protein